MKKLFIYHMLFVFLLFAACKPALLGEFMLTDEEKATVPFAGTEEVKYAYNDSLVSLSCEYRVVNTTEYTGGVNTNDYYIFETDETKFSGDGFDVYYSLRARDVWYTQDRFGITWHDNVNNLYKSTSFILPLDTDYLEDSQGYLDHMIVQGIHYQEVYYDSLEADTTSAGSMKPLAFFYSKDAGLIRIDFQDGASWELKEISWK